MLQTMAAPLVKVYACTRDVLWRWPHCSLWINKIKQNFFWNQSHYFTVRPRKETFKWWNSTALIPVELWCVNAVPLRTVPASEHSKRAVILKTVWAVSHCYILFNSTNSKL
jgi:hypothetical protein